MANVNGPYNQDVVDEFLEGVKKQQDAGYRTLRDTILAVAAIRGGAYALNRYRNGKRA